MTPRLLSRAAALLCLAAVSARAEPASLNMGLDYRLRAVSVSNNDLRSDTSDHLGYYSQSARMYMTAWLNEDVEMAFRLHSINVWGLEGSSAPVTRYPAANGTPWVEQAYVHMPNLAWKKLRLVIGRQPVVIGDGLLVSDDGLGFNAVRGQVSLPWKCELDLFTAKVSEALGGNDDHDLRGVVFRTEREHRHWELSWIEESNQGQSIYRLASSTYTASRVLRRFYDVRLFGDLEGAYYKLEVALQGGDASLASGQDVGLKGSGQRLELGAQKDTARFGRFGVRALYAVGSGDDAGSPGTDEAFRPTFGRRWDGLQRAGYGSHFGATLSDAYDRASPFSPDSTGLPPGFSGIKTIGMGIFSTQRVFWTGSLDYYVFEARTKPTGLNDLGTELDANLTYRYTGFVTFQFGAALFFPGGVYGGTASRAMRTSAEVHVHF